MKKLLTTLFVLSFTVISHAQDKATPPGLPTNSIRPLSIGPTVGLAPALPLPSRAPKSSTESPASSSDGSSSSSSASSSSASSSSTGANNTSSNESEERQRPPKFNSAKKVTIDFVDTSLFDLIKFFAEITESNFILADEKELSGKKVTIISHRPVSVNEAWEAFLSALKVAGYTTYEVGGSYKVVKSNEAGQAPITVGQGGDIDKSNAFITQLIPLDNVSVTEINSVVTSLASKNAKIIAYAPTNTLIITDAAHNLRKVFKILTELDVAAPRSSLAIFPIQHAAASEIASVIEQIYGTQTTSTPSSDSRSSRASSRNRRNQRNRGNKDKASSNNSVTAGKESKYISKVLADERTNALIVLANEQGHAAVTDIIAKLDVDVDLTARSQIHVVYLEHAKADDVAQVLANLSDKAGGSSSSRNSSSRTSGRSSNRNNTTSNRPGARNLAGSKTATADGSNKSGAIAAFDSGMRITSDENTNSLVIIASQEDYRVVKSVIDQLDVKRKQVFVDAVILEISSEDALEFGTAYHGPVDAGEGNTGLLAGGFSSSMTSLGLTADVLSGLALGIFGKAITIPLMGGNSIDVPAFGVVLNALKTNSIVNIVSNPNLMTLDNEEAEITIGRKVPFPSSSQINSLTGSPVVSYQREDVATTIKVTPRINSSNFVTLEVIVEVSEIEEDDKGLDVNQSGFITSKREVETVVMLQDNQTAVIGGLVGTTDTKVESKVPILGDLPLIGALFRGTRTQSRKTNLMIFLTPHIIETEEDMAQVMRIKEAQRQEFLRRFYGKSRDKQMAEIRRLLQFSMNNVDQPTYYRSVTSSADAESNEPLILDLDDSLPERSTPEPADTSPEVTEPDEDTFVTPEPAEEMVE